MFTSSIEIVIGGALLLSMLLAIEVGYRLGRRHHHGGGEIPQFGTIQSAALGLLALLLGFTFSGATTRFIQRQDVMVSEANAVGTAYLRADLLDEPFRSELRKALSDYLDDRIALADELRESQTADIERRLLNHQHEMWKAAAAGVQAKPTAIVGVLPPVNEVIDLLATRNALASRHLPSLVLALLFSCALVSLATIGYGSGLAGKRHMSITGALALLIATALWVTIDLDYPKRGLVRAGSQPLVAARDDLQTLSH